MRFQEAYLRLNERQKHAVDIIYGPVLTLAGAGTGKTQVLSTRVTRMLQSEAQISPENILCLTYTDAGAKSMRQRLVQFIGAAAYRVTITTFHSFCSDIIKHNMDFFGFRDLEPVDELENVRIIYDLINSLGHDNPLVRLKGDPYFEVYRLLSLFTTMKEEGWDYGSIKAGCDRWIAMISDKDDPHPDFVYKVANKNKGVVKGDLKVDKINDEKKNCELIIAAAALFPTYQRKLTEINRYDFSDMIHWVIGAFRSDMGDWLLMNYQERYHYILVDEFQDTSGPQMELLQLLTNYWDNPNLFVVGDDDQTLFTFSGARIQNIMDYVRDYKPEIICLNENYRSTQGILDTAMNVISNNKVRLKSRIDLGSIGGDYTKLISKTGADSTPKCFVLKNTLEEEAYITDAIVSLIESGVQPDTIAVLYRKHKQSENIIKMLSSIGVPVNARKRVNVLHEPVISQLTRMLRYCYDNENLGSDRNDLLYEILHYPYMKMTHQQINQYIKSKVSGEESQDVLSDLQMKSRQMSIPGFIIELIEESGLLKWAGGHSQSRQMLVVLSTFIDWVKSYCFKNPLAEGIDMMKDIDKMLSRNIPITCQDIYVGEQGVCFSTVHASKGLEWDHVFLIGCISSEWEKARGVNDSYRLPPTITKAEGDDKLEAARRLFYVATTRAKQSLTITLAGQNNDAREQEATMFIPEAGLEVKPERLTTSMGNFYDRLYNLLNKTNPRLAITDTSYLQELVDGYELSPSAINKFLKCRLTWYYENLIRVPFALNGALVFGNAVHYAMKMFYDAYKERSVSLEELMGWFDREMNRYKGQISPSEFFMKVSLGEKLLPPYWEDVMVKSNRITLNEFRARNITLENGVPVKGDIDKIEFNGSLVTIVDYKTGKLSSIRGEIKPADGLYPGGDIWRQLMVYSLIVDQGMRSKEWKTERLAVEVLDSDHSGRVEVEFSRDQQRVVSDQVKMVWDSIQALDFLEGCGEKGCKWCDFHKMI